MKQVKTEKLNIVETFLDRYFQLFVLAQLAFIFTLDRFVGSENFIFPDERGYLQIASSLHSDPPEYFGWGWPWKTPIYVVQFLYLPFWVLTKFGLEDLVALRVTSVIYTSLAVFLLLLTFHSLTKNSWQKRSFSIIRIFIFIPSFFVFGTFGLREPIIYFSTSSIIFGLMMVIYFNRKMFTIFIFFGLYFLISTKEYLGLLSILCLSVAVTSHFVGAIRERNSTIFKEYCKQIGLILGPILAVVIALNPIFISSLQHFDHVANDNPRRTNLSGNSTNGTEGAWQTEREIIDIATKTNSPVNNLVLKIIKPEESLMKKDVGSGDSSKDTTQREQNISEPELRAKKLSLEATKLTDIDGNLRQVIVLLVKPTPFLDNGSSILNIASIETVMWWLLLTLWLVTYFRKRKWTDAVANYALSFFFLFLAGSASLEINLGTWLRHKSILVPIVLFSLVWMVFKDNLKNDVRTRR